MYKILTLLLLSISLIQGCAENKSEEKSSDIKMKKQQIGNEEKSLRNEEKSVEPTQKAEFSDDAVSYAGSLKEVMAGNMKATISLSEFKGVRNLYALGVAENLQGEIQIFNGKVENSRRGDEMVVIERNFHKSAAFLVYAVVEEWREIDIPSSIKAHGQLENFIQQELKKAGMDVEKSYPFMVTGNVAKLDWHVVNWDMNNKDHSIENHMKYGLNGVMSAAPVEIIGFYSRNHKGIFTHQKSNVHMHFRTDQLNLAGHVDQVFLGGNMKLKLPKK